MKPGAAGSRASAGGAEGRLPSGRIVVWLLLAAVTMMFVAFTSSYVIHRAQVPSVAVPLPGLLWLNTLLLLASSATLEWGSAEFRRGSAAPGRRALVATLALGLGFVAGQVAAWTRLAAAGVFLHSSPHSSFFYLLTGVHGLHLLGGVVALAVVLSRARAASEAGQALRAVGPAATYWHFMGGLWVYLFALLFWL